MKTINLEKPGEFKYQNWEPDLSPEVALMDLNADRLAFCQKYLEVQQTINPVDRKNSEQALRGAFNGHLPTVVLDATGSKKINGNGL